MSVGGGSANGGLGHLLTQVAALIQRPVEDRIWFARQDKWVGYTRADEALAAMRDLVDQPGQRRRQGMLLAGRANNGKSSLLARFEEENPVTTAENGCAVCPVVLMDLPPKADEGRLWSALLTALKVPHRDSDPVGRKERQALAVLEQVRCRVLLIDEIHNLLLGHASQQRQLLGALKSLVNALWLPMVVAGTADAIRALNTDVQLATRFKPFGLPRWELNREFLKLLASFEAVLPLAEPSHLASREMAIKLFELSAGTIGGVMDTLKAATVLALRGGQERIDLTLLARLEMTTVANYGRQADRL